MQMMLSKYEKQDGKWVQTRNEKKEITWEHYQNYTGAVDFFRNLGGTEHVTVNNGLVTEIVSVSPCGNLKTVAEFSE